MECNGHFHTLFVFVMENGIHHFVAHGQHIINHGTTFALCILALFLATVTGGLTVNRQCAFIRIIYTNNIVVHIHVFNTHTHQRQFLRFHAGGIKVVVAVGKLDNLALAITHGHIIIHFQILQRLDQTTLNISGLGCLDRSINQTNTTTHCVEEEFGGSEAGNIRVLNVSTCIGCIVKLGIMGQGAVIKSIRNTFAFHRLLTQTRNHLGNVDQRAFGTRIDNHEETVVLVQTLTTNFAGLVIGLFH